MKKVTLQTTQTLYRPGDITDTIWAGDIVSKCEFIRPLTGGGLLFWDRDVKCFRRAFWEQVNGTSRFVLNGWDASDTPFTS